MKATEYLIIADRVLTSFLKHTESAFSVAKDVEKVVREQQQPPHPFRT
jgi:hypothetical protein